MNFGRCDFFFVKTIVILTLGISRPKSDISLDYFPKIPLKSDKDNVEKFATLMAGKEDEICLKKGKIPEMTEIKL